MSKKAAVIIGALCIFLGIDGVVIQIFGDAGHGPEEALDDVEKPDLVKWESPESYTQLADAADKPILLDFSAVWCGPCKKLARDVFADQESASYINENFTPVQVMEPDGEAPRPVKDLQEKFGIKGFPTLIVKGKADGQQKSIVGYPGKEETMSFLKESLTDVTN